MFQSRLMLMRTVRLVFVSLVIFVLFPNSARAQQSVTLTIHMVGPSQGTVGVIPNAYLCLTPSSVVCTFQVTPGTVVRLVANGLPGQSPPGRFSAGTGAAAACDLSTCSFTMTAATEVTATFSTANSPTATVTTAVAGDGEGDVGVDNSRCQNIDPAQDSPCLTSYMHGSMVTLTARPAAGSRFSGYAGTAGAASCGSASECSFQLNASATVTGTFHRLTSIAVSPSTATKQVGETQTLLANGTFSNGVTEQIPFGSMGTWRTKQAMPFTKNALGATVANGLLYAIGGNDSGAPGAPGPIVRVYNPVANTWSTAASMPTGREGLGVVTVDGFIYAIGGNKQSSIATDVVERYDPSLNTWTSRAPLPAVRRYLAAGVVNGIIYVVGGETVSNLGVSTTVATVEAYDPATDEWTPRAPMLTARSTHGVGVVNGILYAVGGNLSGPSVEAYDPSTNTWTAKASQPTGGNGMLAVVVVDDVLYAIGGSAVGSATVQYDVARDAWNMKSGMPTSRSELAAVAINGTIYAVGGLAVPNPGPGTNQPLATVEAFTDHLRWRSSAPAVARVTQQGFATAASVGTANIVASVGSLTCGTACGAITVRVIDTTMSVDKSSLQFAAISNGSSFAEQTSSQTVRLTQTGCCTVGWTATPTQPWITVSPTSGTGSATLTIGVSHVGSLPASGGVNGLVSLAFTGATNSSTALSIALNIVPDWASTAPFGVIDTPVNNATGVTGAVPVTGWGLDDVEVTNVSICRGGVAGETAPVDGRCGGAAQIFVGTAVFIDGARPDVQLAFPTFPRSFRGGWGFMVLTNLLPGQGNGTYTLFVYVSDRDNHTVLLGTRTISCSNATSLTPFGAIDTPGQGEVVSGASYVNFGWALTPQPKTIPTDGSTMNVFIDGEAVGTVNYDNFRSDIATLFPGMANTAGAVGFRMIDTTALANGVHTIAWGVSDNDGSATGIGSRYFTVSNGSGLTAASGVGHVRRRPESGNLRFQQDQSSLTQATPARTSISMFPDAVNVALLDPTPMIGRRGYDLEAPWRTFSVGASARAIVQGEELDRFELQVGRVQPDRHATTGLHALPGSFTGYLRVGDDLAPLPIGSHLDAETGVFTWQPGVAFVGQYDLVFVRTDGRAAMRREVRIVLHPKGSGRALTEVVIDTPGQGEIAQPFVIGGWAADLNARAGTGVRTLHVWAYPARACEPRQDSESSGECPGAPIFLGATAYGGGRPDVAEIHGQQYRDSGYGLTVQGLEPGTYDLAVFAWSTVTQGFVPAKVVRVIVR